ncbi:MAG: hypothetical protein RL152_927, partial [Bacteroidota bacterium]
HFTCLAEPICENAMEEKASKENKNVQICFMVQELC